MGLFHTHRWQETARNFVPPTGRKFNLGEATGWEAIQAQHRLVREMANGYTVVELRCTDCGDISWRNLPGDQRRA